MNTPSFFNRSLLLTCASALLLLAAPVAVQGQFVYVTNNGAITITGYTGPGGAVNIPTQINGLPVASIGNDAFLYRSNLTSVMIPDSVTSLEVEAFFGCSNLTNVAIGNGVTRIGDQAFYGCASLTSVTIPNSLTSIGERAFVSCGGLTSVTIPNSVTSIGEGAFVYCYSLSAINVAAQNPVYSSLNGVLFDKSLTTLVEFPAALGGSYTVPDSVTSLEGAAFSGCNSLTSVTIPNGVTNISLDGRKIFFGGFDTFYACSSLSAINVAAQNPVYSSLDGVLFDKNHSMLLFFPMGLGGSYTISNGVTSIGDFAFFNCSLTSVTIPDGVTRIGDSAFYYCSSLTNATIGSSVTNIGFDPFSGCSSLGAINVSTQNPVYSSLNGVLFDKDLTTLVEFPAALGGSYTVPDSVTTIGDSAFQKCSGLTSVIIPNGVTTIGDAAFFYCPSLTNVFIGSSVTNIGDLAFTSCEHLTNVYFRGDAPNVASDVFIFNNVNMVVDPATIYYLPNTSGWSNTLAGRPTTLWLPQALTEDGSFGVQSNQFGFNIAWASGQTVMVEAATNLSNPIWFPVATNVLTSGTSYFSDPQSSNFSARFYRLRSP